MIDVVYDRKALRLSVRGHAHSGAAGHDLVCAAASMLVYTLASDASQMPGEKEIALAEGDAVISCRPVHGMQAVTTLVFDAVCAGFDVLAQAYPENVRYCVQG